MSNDVFDGEVLSEKLSKLNNSQQSIESLSQWCITHRKKAKLVVETWDKLFNSSQKEQCVSFLYLANDILQNSRRKGSEFVNEFWKVLPTALKHVYDNGDESGKKAVTRLVGIWEERKVFGSRGQNLKGELLGKSTSPVLINSVKNSNPIKIVKRDANAVRIKLAVGDLPEKILTAFEAVFDDNADEEDALSKSSLAAQLLTKIAKDADNNIAQGNLDGSAILDKLQQQEETLHQSLEQLESAERTRADLIYQLKAALQEQETKVENIRIHMQVARGHIDQASTIRRRLTSNPVLGPPISATVQPAEALEAVERNYVAAQQTSVAHQPLPSQPVVSFVPSKITDEENKKAVAAAMAAKLAASTSSAQMLSSVLSSLAAEEAASRISGSFTPGSSLFPPEKRAKLENSIPISDVNKSDIGNAAYFSSMQQQQQQQQQQQVTNSGQTSSGMISQGNNIQAPFSPAPPPPLPPVSLANPGAGQYVQSAGLMIGAVPYGYGASTLPPPPPLPPHIAMSLARPLSQPQQQTQSQPMQQQQQQQPQSQSPQQQQAATGGFYRPPGVGFYGQNHQSTAPPVPRH